MIVFYYSPSMSDFDKWRLARAADFARFCGHDVRVLGPHQYGLRHHGGTDLAATSSVAASDASNPPKQQGSAPTERKDV